MVRKPRFGRWTAVCLLAFVGWSSASDVWAQAALKLAPKPLLQLVPNQVAPVEMVPAIAPALVYGNAFLYLGWGAYEFKQHLIPKDQSPLTEATPAQRDAWAKARDMAKSRPQGFAVPHAVTSDDLLEYVRKNNSRAIPSSIAPAAGGVRNSSESRRLPKEIEELIDDLASLGKQSQKATIHAQRVRRDAQDLLSLSTTLTDLKEAVERAMEFREKYAMQLMGHPDWNEYEELDQTFLYFIGLAATQFAWSYDYDGLRDTYEVLRYLAEEYSSDGYIENEDPVDRELFAVRNNYFHLGKQLEKWVEEEARVEHERFFSTGKGVQQDVLKIVQDIRERGRVPASVRFKTVVFKFDKEQTPDLSTFRAVLWQFWRHVLANRDPDNLEIQLYSDRFGITHASISASVRTGVSEGIRKFEEKTAWMKQRPFDLGTGDLRTEIRPAAMGSRSTVVVEFRLKDRWAWE